jgi:glucose-1-phosphate thymidylyltransferase
MRGLILSGGTGSRLRPFTYTRAKQLLPLANKPVILYAVEALVEAGITEIGIVTGHSGDQFKKALGGGEAYGARFTYLHQEAPRGLADAVLTGEAFVGDQPFAVFLGDNFLHGGVAEHVQAFRDSNADAQLTLKQVPDPRSFGIAALDSAGRPVKLLEKPAEPPTNLAILGVYMLTRPFFDSARSIKPSARGELEITDALQHLIDLGADVTARVVEGDWVDTGTANDLLAANRRILEDLVGLTEGAEVTDSLIDSTVVLGEGTRVVDSTIEGPAIIGRGVHIAGCRIGAGTSIGDGCSLTGVDIAASILLENVNLNCPGLCLRDSIIGRGARVTGSGPVAELKLRLGDESEVSFL